VSLPIGVVGGGSFGRGLATAIARNGGEVVLWSRREQSSGATRIDATTDIERLGECELIFVSVPSMHVPTVAPMLGAHLDGRHLLVHVSRGLIGEELQTVSRYLAAATPARRVGCLAGPINPEVLAEGVPGGGVVGTGFPEVADAVRDAIAGPQVRLYDTADTTGVEVASAMVGLLALAAGFGLETKISPAALAIMMNRGLAEAARVGEMLGADAETFHGMAGAGDLFAALAGDERAEVRLGRALARSTDLEKAGEEAGAYIEGLSIARRVTRFAERVGVQTPISAAIANVIDGELSIEGALEALMSR
jgi:glycerol-3-phosphate dehydrogenase (NAD(P)+)